MARLLADENFPFRAVEALRVRGHDFVTMLDIGRANAGLPDETVLAVATDDRRAVVTLNRRHFVRLHESRPNHAGIIVCTPDPNVTALADRIHQAIGGRTALDGLLLRIVRPSS